MLTLAIHKHTTCSYTHDCSVGLPTGVHSLTLSGATFPKSRKSPTSSTTVLPQDRAWEAVSPLTANPEEALMSLVLMLSL